MAPHNTYQAPICQGRRSPKALRRAAQRIYEYARTPSRSDVVSVDGLRRDRSSQVRARVRGRARSLRFIGGSERGRPIKPGAAGPGAQASKGCRGPRSWDWSKRRGAWTARAREAVGLPHVRCKDLRGGFAATYRRANPGGFRGLQHILVDATLEQTMR